MKSLFSGHTSRSRGSVDVRRALVEPTHQFTQSAATKDVKPRTPRKAIWCVCSVASHGDVVREAIIMDVSKTGARLRFHVRGRLPERVWIKASRIGLNRPARVVWQDLHDAGVQFIAADID